MTPCPTSERTLNDPETVAAWAERFRSQFERYLDFEGPFAARIVNNLDWTSGLSAISLLRDIGKYFRVNTMIAKEAVARRLNSDAGISYTEFSYQVLQGMDYLELNRRYGCTLQTGGSDQWGNLTAGTELIRKAEGRVVHALGTPLVTKADGTKFGKTETGTLWLDPELTTPYAFYQFWLNADDRDVVNYLRIFTFRSQEEIAELERLTAEQPAARAAERALAEDVTVLVDGEEQYARAVAASKALFGQGDLADLDAPTLAAAVAQLPHVEVGTDSGCRRTCSRPPAWSPASRPPAGRSRRAGPTSTTRRSPTRRPLPTEADLLHGRWLLLRRGKRSLAAVQLNRS